MSGPPHRLPVEIISEIVEYTTTVDPTGERNGLKELRCLRLVSKYFNYLASPLLFSTLRLEFMHESEDGVPHYFRCQEIVMALAIRSTNVFCRTKKLYLDTEFIPDLSAHAQTLILDNIFDAICALENLRTIDWPANSRCDLEEITIDVIHALSKLPSFQGFEYLRFHIQSLPYLSLKPLSNLTIFRTHWDWKLPARLLPEVASLLSRCPELTELSLGGNFIHQNLDLHEVFSEICKLENPWELKKLELRCVAVTPDDFSACIHHFKHLTSLGIYGTPRTFGGICDILQKNKITLKDVSTDHPDDPLFFHYLSSYSGLTSLELKIPVRDRYQWVTPYPTFLNELYMRVVRNHAETLEHLKLEWIGLPTKEELAELLKCQRLTILQVSIDVGCEALQQALSEGDASVLVGLFLFDCPLLVFAC
ncbi:hypothetical protein AGABI1DRAFT_104848 [Agaricus bisporus var. burnettii JB137-S8]|uniref:F-box domain-containing protein n=1 Tax=Agaricus bisporus var. burnettii (strain JB137-S8 / ATCC MYA-4627 / FGSC 10392) TaxID=597362 RepID=K5W8D8_AGABU|nr:uncharacterized protein AGABI1DRAFT_104848 [Agaricus bisporus var. burnettii JB137-S8]EKM83094.1 hypothetical protein AGABI1DRAFT_104848 [Agaricus bisporus var. burnettii JB137-S8]